METSIVTSKGQIVIPSKIRRRFGIKRGTHVCFVEGKHELVLRPITDDYIEFLKGSLGTRGKVLKALLEEKAKERRR